MLDTKSVFIYHYSIAIHQSTAYKVPKEKGQPLPVYSP